MLAGPVSLRLRSRLVTELVERCDYVVDAVQLGLDRIALHEPRCQAHVEASPRLTRRTHRVVEPSDAVATTPIHPFRQIERHTGARSLHLSREVLVIDLNPPSQPI